MPTPPAASRSRSAATKCSTAGSARNGETVTAALQRAILDTIARIEKLLHCYGEAASVLAAATGASLTRAQIGLPVESGAVAAEAAEANEPA